MLVDVSEITQLIHSALSESLLRLEKEEEEKGKAGRYGGKSQSSLVPVKPGVVENVKCIARPSPAIDPESQPSSTGLEILVTWDPPWNSAQMESYGVMVEEKSYEFRSKTPSFTFRGCEPGATYNFWIRSLIEKTPRSDEIFGVYSERCSCICQMEVYVD